MGDVNRRNAVAGWVARRVGERARKERDGRRAPAGERRGGTGHGPTTVRARAPEGATGPLEASGARWVRRRTGACRMLAADPSPGSVSTYSR